MIGCDRSADSAKVRTKQIPADPGFSVVPSGSSEAANAPEVIPRRHGKRVEKMEGEWANILPDLVFRVTRQGATEPRFTGEMYRQTDSGSYQCFCCEATLFVSDDKYNSGSGWPTFKQPVSAGVVWTEEDASAFRDRVAVRCSVCDAQLGHVFDDGPPPDGRRYNINSSALKFIPEPAPSLD